MSVLKKLKKISNNSKVLNTLRARYAPLYIKKHRDRLLFDDSQFFRVNLGCKADTYVGYVNFDDTRTKGRVLVSSFLRLPFRDNEVKLLLVDYTTLAPYEKQLDAVFREFRRVLVSNGTLTFDNIPTESSLVRLVEQHGFKRIFPHSDEYVPILSFVADQKDMSVTPMRELHYTVSGDVLSFSRTAADETEAITFGELAAMTGCYTCVEVHHILEYCPPFAIETLIAQVYALLSDDGEVSFRIREEVNEPGVNFFDKSILAQYLRNQGFVFKNIELREGVICAKAHKKISLHLPTNVRVEKKKRVCVLGQYLLCCYNHLGLDWDGLAYAFDQLGWDTLLLESMRNMSYEDLRDAIVRFKPDYLFLMLKETLPLLRFMEDDLKRLGIKTIFWYCDPDDPWEMDLSGVLDCMFLSNAGQLQDYKKALNIDRAYFMTQAISPYVMYKMDVPEVFDIAFLGAVSKVSLHSTRKIALQRLCDEFNVSMRNNIRNNVTEFYSESKMVFGCSNFNYDLYTSNRFWVVLGCGAVYLTAKFPGIERLVRNKEHVLWYESFDEMMDIARYYLQHDDERKKIGQNAAKLAREKHTYAHRLQNIFDIVEGKTNEFYGFLD